MSPGVAKIIDAARDLAWRGSANRSGLRLAERNEAVTRLRELVTETRRDRRTLDPEDPAWAQLDALLRAIVRTAECSWANRRGEAYYHRKRVLAELRGCLESYDSALR